MLSISDDFQAALLGAHTATFKLEVLQDGAVIYSIENGDTSGVGIVGGSVSVDATAQTQRTGSVQIVDPDGELIPNLATDMFAPYGNELRLHRGVEVNGEAENVPVITGGMYNVEINRQPNGWVLECDIFDRSRLVSMNRWSDVYNVASGTNASSAVSAILQDRLPAALWASMVTSFDATSLTTSNLIFGGSGGTNDPMADVSDLAASVGKYVGFDGWGNPYLRPIPDPTTQSPVWEIEAGSNLLQVTRRLTAEATYNGVIITGQNTATSTPYYSVVWDTDTASPTYYLGRFGKRPLVITNPKVNSSTGATVAANAELLLQLGGTEIVSFGTIVNPALEAYDVVLVDDSEVGISSTRYVLSSFNIPLDVSTPQSATCRVRRT